MPGNDRKLTPSHSTDFYGDRQQVADASIKRIQAEKDSILEKAQEDMRGLTSAEQDRIARLDKERNSVIEQQERDAREQNSGLTGEDLDRLDQLQGEAAAGKMLSSEDQQELDRLQNALDSASPVLPEPVLPFDPPGPDSMGRMIAEGSDGADSDFLPGGFDDLLGFPVIGTDSDGGLVLPGGFTPGGEDDGSPGSGTGGTDGEGPGMGGSGGDGTDGGGSGTGGSGGDGSGGDSGGGDGPDAGGGGGDGPDGGGGGAATRGLTENPDSPGTGDTPGGFRRISGLRRNLSLPEAARRRLGNVIDPADESPQRTGDNPPRIGGGIRRGSELPRPGGRVVGDPGPDDPGVRGPGAEERERFRRPGSDPRITDPPDDDQ